MFKSETGVMKVIGYLIAMAFLQSAKAQVVNPYHLNGSAVQENCNCYTLTSDHTTQSGSLWNINKISLAESFDFKFNVFLGCNDSPGADGIVFVLQPISASVGSTGEGLGFQGVSPSIGITIDTYQNSNHGDPVYDHTAIHKNGDIDYSSANSLTPAVSALASGGNIEDCNWHTFRIIWNADTKELKDEIDGVERSKATIDLVKDVFGNEPMVFWGFTGATGGESNRQRVCTSLNPGFYLTPDQKTCFPEPIRFLDSSRSFGFIEKYFWDFGDGIIDSIARPLPHVYSEPGKYRVTLNILGNNGCLSDTFSRTVIVGSEPTANFNYSPRLVCENSPINFFDASTVEVGSIDQWAWKLGPQEANGANPTGIFSDPVNAITLVVGTKEGCVSDPVVRSLAVFPKPTADFNFADVCVDQPALFNVISNELSPPIRQWYWDFGEGAIDSLPSASHFFPTVGKYPVQLVALAQNGCASEPAIHEVNIYGSWAFAGSDTVVARNQPVMLNGSGGEYYHWTPAAGLSDDNIPNPVAVLQQDASYVLTVSTPAGCPTSDTINIKVYQGPEFYVPNAFTPNNDGKNDQFKFFPIGMTEVEFFQVYNRFGQLIYSSNDPSRGWDGTFQGAIQASATYVWMIKGKDYLGIPHMKKGTVTLVR